VEDTSQNIENLVSFDEIVAEMRRCFPGQVTTVNDNDIRLLRQTGIDCWHLAGSLAFQRVIDEVGTAEEKQRLRDLKVGYR
jgi:hypothetical protein